MLKKIRSQKGFTLVEIAIVMVIIGLLIAGIIKGGELVTGGKVKKTGKQVDQLKASIYSYMDKNNGAVPADMAALATAGLVPSGLKDAYDNAITVTPDAAGAAATKVTIAFPGVPSDVAQQIDSSMDDGTLTSGDVQHGAGGLTVVVKK